MPSEVWSGVPSREVLCFILAPSLSAWVAKEIRVRGAVLPFVGGGGVPSLEVLCSDVAALLSEWVPEKSPYVARYFHSPTLQGFQAFTDAGCIVTVFCHEALRRTIQTGVQAAELSLR